jgi:hypothetical protein
VTTEYTIQVPDGFEVAQVKFRKKLEGPVLVFPSQSASRSNYDWSKIDWDKSNSQLVAETGLNYQTICKARREVGHKPIATAAHPKIDWKTVDWSRNNQQLSSELRVPVGTVKFIRERNNFQEPIINSEHGNRLITDEMIAAVQWNLSRDIDISKQWHVSRERVRQIRQQRGYPVCAINSVEIKAVEFEKWLLENKDLITDKNAHEVADSCPIKLIMHRKRELMRKSTIPFQWERPAAGAITGVPINWELPNKLLASIWNIKPHQIANHRCQWGKPHPKFTTCGRYFDRIKEIPGFKEALAAEIQKAKTLGKTPVNQSELDDFLS